MQINWVREHPILAVVGTTVLFLLFVVSTAGPTAAQTAGNTTIPTPTPKTTTTTTTTTAAAVTNFTKLLLENKEFQTCISGIQGKCFPNVNVLYQSPTTLVLKSYYVDTIWKVVDLAKKEGYKIDGISTYITTFQDTGTVNALVVMSRG
jgi:hypothetical protein